MPKGFKLYYSTKYSDFYHFVFKIRCTCDRSYQRITTIECFIYFIGAVFCIKKLFNMHQLSSDISEQILYNHNNNNFDDQIQSIGSANTLKRAMTVNKLSDMLDCIKDMKFYAKTIEKDLPDYLDTIYIDRKNEMNVTEFDFLQLAKQRLNNNNRYILLNDLIKQEKVYLS